MRLTILGETAEVESPDLLGPSMYLLEEKRGSAIVDCGAQFLPDGRTILPQFSLLEEKAPVKAVFLTHAHYDHVGGLVELTPYIQQAKVFAAPQTVAVLKVLLSEWLKKERDPLNQVKIRILQSLVRRRSVILREGVNEVPILGKIFVLPAGHIPGAFSLICEKGLLVMGDICWHNQPVVNGARSFGYLHQAWRPAVVTTDLTNAFENTEFKTAAEKLLATTLEALKGGRRVIVAAFQLGKGQNIISLLSPVAARFPVYVDGGIRLFTHLLNRYRWGGSRYTDTRVTFIKSAIERESLASSPNPMLVIASGGMADGGPIKKWLSYSLSREDVVIFTSYLSPWSLGHRLLAAKTGDVVQIATEEDGVEAVVEVPLRAEIKQIRLSSHSSWEKMKEEIEGLSPELVVLTHGAISKKRRAVQELTTATIVATTGTEIEIG